VNLHICEYFEEMELNSIPRLQDTSTSSTELKKKKKKSERHEKKKNSNKDKRENENLVFVEFQLLNF
jgi:hypothetical protein